MAQRLAGGQVHDVVFTLAVDGNGNFVGDREILLTRYTVKQAFTGAAAGDVVLETSVLDVGGGTVSTIAVSWKNETNGVEISAPPSIAGNLEPIKQGDSLTLMQLLSAGLGTAANQVIQIAYLADLAETNDRHATYKLVQSEDLGAGTKYILKSDGNGWLMIRKIYTDTASTLSYAGVANNAGVTLTQAWGQRASLTYAATVGGA